MPPPPHTGPLVIVGLATFPVFFMLGFTSVTPIAPIVLLGFTYSLAAASLWPSVALLVPMQSVGLAYGCVNFLQMISIGVCNILIGWLRDGSPACPTCVDAQTNPDCKQNLSSWHNVMIFMLINAGLCVLMGLVLNALDARAGGVLNLQKPNQGSQSAGFTRALTNMAINDGAAAAEEDSLLRSDD